MDFVDLNKRIRKAESESNHKVAIFLKTIREDLIAEALQKLLDEDRNAPKGDQPKGKKTGVPEQLALRRRIVQAAADSHPKKKGKQLDRLTCELLDQTDVLVPDHWAAEFGVENWTAALGNEKMKPRVQTMFSKDRKLAGMGQ